MSGGNGTDMSLELRVSRLEMQHDSLEAKMLAEFRDVKEMIIETRKYIAEAHAAALSAITLLYDAKVDKPKAKKKKRK